MSDNLLTYDVAVSFAGEVREYVERLSNALTQNGLRVFYDNYEIAEMWGKNLYDHLTDVYKRRSKYCLMVISEHYAKKQWTTLERQAAQAKAFAENKEYILPLRLDDSQVPGVLETIGYVDARHKSIEEIVDLLKAKVIAYNQANGITAEIVRVEDACNRADFRDPDGQQIKVNDSMFKTSCPTCSTEQLLSEAHVNLIGEETVYECKNGCQIIVVVGKPGVKAWEGRGWRLKNYVIRNTRDMFLKFDPQQKGGVVIRARPASLMKENPKNI